MYDVIVLGLGGMGSAAAYHLSRRGERVLGLDRYTAPHELGSSHGGSRIIRQAYHEHPNYVPLLLRAYELWEQLQQDATADILHITGGLNIGPENSSVVTGAIRSAREHGLAHDILAASDLQRRFPAFHPRPHDAALFEKRAGYIRPEAAVRAHLALAAKHGAELHFEERVESWSATSSCVQVATPLGTYEADRLVLAPGAWAPQLLSDLAIPFDVRRQVMCWFHPTQRIDVPVYIYDVDARDVFYGFPPTGDVDGAMKAAMHTAGDRCTADTIERDTSEADAAVLRRHLSQLLPALNGPLVKASTCLYTLTPDEHFVLATHPHQEHVVIAAGFSGHGFKFTTVIGEIVADLIISGKTNAAIDFFSPKRFDTPYN